MNPDEVSNHRAAAEALDAEAVIPMGSPVETHTVVTLGDIEPGQPFWMEASDAYDGPPYYILDPQPLVISMKNGEIFFLVPYSPGKWGSRHHTLMVIVAVPRSAPVRYGSIKKGTFFFRETLTGLKLVEIKTDSMQSISVAASPGSENIIGNTYQHGSETMFSLVVPSADHKWKFAE